jgi:hypothetical protein
MVGMRAEARRPALARRAPEVGTSVLGIAQADCGRPLTVRQPPLLEISIKGWCDRVLELLDVHQG